MNATSYQVDPSQHKPELPVQYCVPALRQPETGREGSFGDLQGVPLRYAFLIGVGKVRVSSHRGRKRSYLVILNKKTSE
jgi:hypothetical protein